MSNTPRQGSAYIITGVRNRPGSVNKVVGIGTNIDDNSVQLLLKRWLKPIPQVYYYEVKCLGKIIGVFEIQPGQHAGPYYLRDDLSQRAKKILRKQGKFLMHDLLYFRRGTRNDWAEEAYRDHIASWFRSYQNDRWQDWEKFKAGCDYFDEQRHYILIISPMSHVNQSQLEALAHVNWSAVIDFDTKSDETGLLKSLPKTYTRNVIRAVKGEYPSFNSWHNTYWFFAQGLKGRQQTLLQRKDWKAWRAFYGPEIDRQFHHIAQTLLPNPVTFIVIWNDDAQLRHLLTTIESTTGYDSAKYIIVSDITEGIKSRIEDDFDASYFEIPIHHLASGLTVEFPVRSLDGTEHTFPSGEGGGPMLVPVDQLPWLQSQLELVHQGIGILPSSDDVPEYIESDFLRGGVITWNELNFQRDAQRDITRRISRRVRDDLSRRDTRRIEINHVPGAGGTTVSRRVVWDMHQEFPSVVIHSGDLKGIVDRIDFLAQLTRLSVLALVDSADFSDSEIEGILSLLQSRNIPCVLLSVSRRHRLRNESVRSFPLKIRLTNSELPRFVDKFATSVPTRRKELRALIDTDVEQTQTAFHFGLTAYGADYRGITSYVSHRVDGLTETQKEVIVFLSIAYSYGHWGVSTHAFRYLLGIHDRDVSLLRVFEDRQSMFDILILDDSDWRPIHQAVAQELLAQLLSEAATDMRLWTQELSSWGKRFIEFCATGHLVKSKTLLTLLRRVFIDRDSGDAPDQGTGNGIAVENSRSNFLSRFIEDIPSRQGQLEVFKYLCDLFPEVPHFWGHLGRFQSTMMGDYEAALESADISINLDDEDPYLWHMKGMSYRSQMLDVIRSRGELSDVVALAIKAGSCFEESRRLDPEEDSGYISEVQLLVIMLNYVVRETNESIFQYVKRFNAIPYVRDAIDKAESLLSIVRSNREGTEVSTYEKDCRAKISTLYGDYSEALQIWEGMLSRQDVYHPTVRRQIVYALKARDTSWKDMTQKSRNRCIDLLQRNLDEQPYNDRDLRLWLDVVRYSLNKPSIESVIEKITYWKSNTGALDATYYLYVLYSLLAIDGFTIERKFALHNMEECKQSSLYRRNRSRSKEWLGKESGIGKLVHQSILGEWNRERNFWSNSSVLQRAEGIITRVVGPQAGNIEIAGLPGFFVPGSTFSTDSINRRVSFYLGFSYSGIRAWDVTLS